MLLTTIPLQLVKDIVSSLLSSYLRPTMLKFCLNDSDNPAPRITKQKENMWKRQKANISLLKEQFQVNFHFACWFFSVETETKVLWGCTCVRKYLKYFNRSQSIANFLGKIRVNTPFLLQKIILKKSIFQSSPKFIFGKREIHIGYVSSLYFTILCLPTRSQSIFSHYAVQSYPTK